MRSKVIRDNDLHNNNFLKQNVTISKSCLQLKEVHESFKKISLSLLLLHVPVCRSLVLHEFFDDTKLSTSSNGFGC